MQHRALYPCRPRLRTVILPKLLSELSASNITLVSSTMLSIDIEGAELAVLTAFDFDAVKVDLVLVESARHEDELSYMMHTRGFSKHPRVHGDLVFVRRRAKGFWAYDPVDAAVSESD